MITILLEKIKALLSELKSNIENIKTSIDYSMDEQIVGTWTEDGITHDVYRKSFHVKELNYSGNYEIVHGITNIKAILNGFGSCTIDGNTENALFSPFARCSTDNASIGFQIVTKTSIFIWINTAFGTRPTDLYVTIDYLKNEEE